MLNKFDKHAPIIPKREKSKPAAWLTPGIKAAMNHRHRQLRKFCKTKSDKDKIKYQHMRKNVKILQRKAKSNYNKELLRVNANDPDKFGKTIKSICHVSAKQTNHIQRFEINGEISSAEKTAANGFKIFFSEVIRSWTSKAIRFVDFIWCKPRYEPQDIQNISFQTCSTRRRLWSLKTTA